MDAFVGILLIASIISVIIALMNEGSGVFAIVSLTTCITTVIAFALAVVLIPSSVTRNEILYEQNISVNTNSYKEWVIDHEAKLAKERLK